MFGTRLPGGRCLTDLPCLPRPKVLVIAEAANPEWVSVPLVGWSMAMALREVAEVHLVTQIRNREAILRAGLEEGRDFTAIDSEALARPVWKLAERLRMGDGKGWTTLQAANALLYPHFEKLVWRQFGPDIGAGRYDIVHRVTPLSPIIASPLAGRCRRAGVPFVLGPLNGGVPWPRQFEAERRAEKEWLTGMRRLWRRNPALARTLEHASAILAGSKTTRREIAAKHHAKTVYLPENGIDPARFARPHRPDPERLRVAFVGRLVPLKGVDMLIGALAPLLKDGRAALDIIGDGPSRPALEAQVSALGCGAGITFHGWQEHMRVQEILSRAHLLGFPSIREFGGGAVLEAMALGVVPVVVDYAGPGELVTDEIGFKVPCDTREEITRALGAVFEGLAPDPGGLAPRSQAARARVASHFTWSRKARQVLAVYDWVRSPQEHVKPEFF